MSASNESKLFFFKSLINELTSVFAWANFCNQVVGIEDIYALASNLVNTVSVPVDYLYRLYRFSAVKVSLDQLVEQSRGSMLYGTSTGELFQDLFEIPEEYRQFRVWSYVKDLYFTPLELLAWWVTVCKNQLVSTEWVSDSEYLTFTVRLSGGVNARRLEIEDSKFDLWALEVESDPACLPSDSLAAALSIVQLAARQGGGVFALTEIASEQIEIHYSIPKAEKSSTLPRGWLNEYDRERVVVTNFITELIALGFKDACQQLNLALSTEGISHLESLQAKEETNETFDLCVIGLHNAVNKLGEILRQLDDFYKFA